MFMWVCLCIYLVPELWAKLMFIELIAQVKICYDKIDRIRASFVSGVCMESIMKDFNYLEKKYV